MSKHVCRVVGHRIVNRGKEEMIKIELSSPEGLRASFVVRTEDAETYPMGCEASLGFTIQQSLPLTNGDGGLDREKAPKRGRKAKDAEGAAVPMNAVAF